MPVRFYYLPACNRRYFKTVGKILLLDIMIFKVVGIKGTPPFLGVFSVEMLVLKAPGHRSRLSVFHILCAAATSRYPEFDLGDRE